MSKVAETMECLAGAHSCGGEEAYYGGVNAADGSVLVLVYDESEPGCRAGLLLCKWSYAVSTSPFCSSELVTER